MYFIDHDIGEIVPDHSTICKTRKRIPREIFEKVFTHILKMCVDAGLVSGKTQSIDSAYINANASLERMEEVKLVDRDHDEYLQEVFGQDLPEEFTIADKVGRVNKLQKDLIRYAEGRKKKYDKLYGTKQKNKRRTFSNATHRSSTDPDARVAKKSGKPRMLCYTSTMSVDTQENVITNISAEHSSHKDSQILIKNTKQTMSRLEEVGLELESLLADAGFSSGENYAMLEELGIEAYIPLHGTYSTHREHFKYDGRRNGFICRGGQVLKPSYTKWSDGRKQVAYTSSKKICDKCPLREECVNRKGIKQIMSTRYKKEYERMIKRLKSKEGKLMNRLRMHTVEPVFGSLQQYYGLRRMSVRGRNNASKVMLMSAATFNLKKWVKSQIEKGENNLKSKIFTLRDVIIDHSRRILNLLFLNMRYTVVQERGLEVFRNKHNIYDEHICFLRRRDATYNHPLYSMKIKKSNFEYE